METKNYKIYFVYPFGGSMNYNKIGGFSGGGELDINKLQQQLPQGSTSSVVGYDNPRDWKEDFSHENGNYSNICIYCNQKFIGHKRRVGCRICSLSITQAEEIK